MPPPAAAHAGSPRPTTRYSFHGVPVQLTDELATLAPEIHQLLAPFATAAAADPATPPISGTLRPYAQAEVVRTLSANAVRVATPHLALGHASDVCMELYQEGDRFWLVDDRWGMAEINLLKCSWRSWVLPTATLDPARCAELAVLWPLAQLLRARGLYLLPAASVARGDWAFLLLSPFHLDAELAALASAGFATVGRRWTCVRESQPNGPLELLHVPGPAKTLPPGPRLLPPADATDYSTVALAAHHDAAPCDAVLIIDAARRPAAHVNELPGQLALDALRRHWPIVELHRLKRQLPLKLATRCRVYAAQLSRRPDDLLVLLTSIMNPAAVANDVPRAPTTVRVRPAADRRFVPSLIKYA